MGRRSYPLDLESIRKDYCDNNMTLREMEKKYGVSFKTIHNRLKDMGVTVKIVRSFS